MRRPRAQGRRLRPPPGGRALQLGRHVTRTGFDCSGLVYAAYRSIGWKLPRSSWDQRRVGRPVRFARLRPGDLLFTEGGGHVQLVVSKRTAISAPQTGERVRYVPLAQLRPAFAGAARAQVVEAASTAKRLQSPGCASTRCPARLREAFISGILSDPDASAGF